MKSDSVAYMQLCSPFLFFKKKCLMVKVECTHLWLRFFVAITESYLTLGSLFFNIPIRSFFLNFKENCLLIKVECTHLWLRFFEAITKLYACS